jgi:DNA replication protein DnaC
MKNPKPELEHILKTLRLTGILENLARRQREAIEEQMSYADFLTLTMSDEVARRDQNKFDSRIRRAGFRGEKTFENFDFAFDPRIDKQLIIELSTCQFIEEKVSTLIVGPCGTGKSHIAQALGHCAVRKGYDVLFATQSQLLASLHAARATNTYARRFNTLIKTPLLIIDDFGLKPLRSPQDDDLHDLIAERYERTATIVTSNLDFSEWGDAFPNKLLGAATIDRLRHGAYQVTLESEVSYRKPKQRKTPQKEQKTEALATA